MTGITAVRERLLEATSLPGLLDAAYVAFENILMVIHAHQEPDDAMFVPFVMAAPCAANGRDAVLFAPSLPPYSLRPPWLPGSAHLRGSSASAARELAELCELLVSRLAEAAGSADEPGDQAGCRDAARYASELRDFLVGPEP